MFPQDNFLLLNEVHNQRQRWVHFKRSFQRQRAVKMMESLSSPPSPLPHLPLPRSHGGRSLSVDLQQCYCFSSPWTGAWTRGEYFYVSRNTCCTLLLLLDLMAQTRCCS